MSCETAANGRAKPDITVIPAESFTLETADYPWIQPPEIEIPTVGVELPDGTEFRYGSLIGFSSAAAKIAAKVPESDSASAQAHLFMSLPSILQGNRYSGIGKVENARSQDKTLLSASRSIAKAVRLIFAIEQDDESSLTSVVLKAGVSMPKDHDKILRVFGVTQIGMGGHKKTRRA